MTEPRSSDEPTITVISMTLAEASDNALLATADVEVGPVRINYVRLVRPSNGQEDFAGFPARREGEKWRPYCQLSGALTDRLGEILRERFAELDSAAAS